MNVISGKYRGRKLEVLEGKNTRPTITRIKEDMFNVLSNYFIYENKVCLDLFAGSGALSLEAISRGIKFAYVNDHYKPALEIVKKNFKLVGQEEYQLFNLDYLKMLDYLVNIDQKIDLIFFDPPFAQIDYYYEFFKYLYKTQLLNKYGILIMESKFELQLTEISYLELLKYKNYKNKYLYILRLERSF